MLANIKFEINPGILGGRKSVKRIRKLIYNSIFFTSLKLNLFIYFSIGY